MRIVMTGATSLVGRIFLLEIIKQNLIDCQITSIVILGRCQKEKSIRQRIEEILLEDGSEYLGVSQTDFREIFAVWRERLTCFEFELDKDNLNMQPQDLEYLRSTPIDFFFHIAALTDFRDSSAVQVNLCTTNVAGMERILKLVGNLKLGEFCYMGSAYSCGLTDGIIDPDYIKPDLDQINSYQRTKLQSEILVRKFAQHSGVRCRYFKPSTICGRLIESPLGKTNKFDVFYSWSAFFLRMKMAILKTWTHLYQDPLRIDLRVCRNSNSGLNMVPVDFVAKAMYQVCMQNDPGESYHLTNNQESPHDLYMPLVMKTLNIGGVSLVDSIPENKNRLEKLYYRTVGDIFTPYAISEPMLFDTRNLESVLVKANLHCPVVNGSNFGLLMEYAKQKNFGLEF